MTTRPNIEELDRLWEEAREKEGQYTPQGTVFELYHAYPELSAYLKALEKELKAVRSQSEGSGTMALAVHMHLGFVLDAAESGDAEELGKRVAAARRAFSFPSANKKNHAVIAEPPKETP